MFKPQSETSALVRSVNLIRRIAIVEVALVTAVLGGIFPKQTFAQKAKTTEAAGSPAANPALGAEWDRLKYGLTHAVPMPMPKGSASSVPAPLGSVIHYNNRTQSAYETLQPEATQSNSANGTLTKIDGRTGVAPEATYGDSTPGKPQRSPEGGAAGQVLKSMPEATAPHVPQPLITPTPPSPYTTPYNFPFNTQYRLLLRFNTAGNDYYYFCSASQSASFQLLSAGHCVYNHDIENNGTNIAGFAQEVWAWPAQTDVVDPTGDLNPNYPFLILQADYPYGVAKSTNLVAYNNWINSSDLNYDFSFITLDRRTGDHIGWMGREWNINTTSLNFDGYPAESPYVSSTNPFQYPGYDANNVIAYTDNRIEMSAYTYGGHSGGGVWRFDSSAGNRYIEGVNSTSNRQGYAEATRFTSTNETTLDNAVTDDNSSRSPAALAQVIEYVFNTTSKSLQNTTAQIGSTFGLTLNAFNAGYAAAGNVNADVYLTTDINNVTSGQFLGTLGLGSLDANTYTVQTQNLAIPRTISPGTYYVGYRLSSANPQYGTDDPDVVITNQTLQASCTSDGFEYDNIYSDASSITSGSSQTHSICSKNDVDYVKFTLTGSSAVTLATAGGTTGGDTTLTLYNSSQTQIDFNDDSNGNYYSTITHSCASNPLPAGTYYAKVASYNGLTIIPSYTLSLSTSSCVVAALNGLAVTPNVVPGGTSSTGSVTLNAAAPAGGAIISLTSNNSAAHIPASVTIPSGSTSASFTVTTTAVTATQSVQFVATYAGVDEKVAFKVTAATATLSSIAVSPNTVTGGVSSTGTVTLGSSASTGGVVVTLSSNNSAAHVPTSVTVPAGAISVNFTVTTSTVTTAQTVQLSATYNSVTQKAAFKVNPGTTPTVSLTSVVVAPNVVTGGVSAQGTITLSDVAPAGGIVVALTSNNSAAHVPASVTVPAGSSSVNFIVMTSSVTATQNVQFSATYSGVTQKVAFKVNTGTVPSVSLTTIGVSPNVVTGGTSATGTVTISGAAPTGGIAVALQSNSSAAVVPVTVTVAAGATTASFSVTTTSVTATQNIQLTGTYNAVTQKAAFKINPAASSSVSLTSVGVSPNVVTGGSNSTGTLTLSGAAPVSGIIVTLTTNNSAAHIPSSVTIAAGATTANFAVTTTTVTATQNVQFVATYNGEAQKAAFKINP